jgi:hypothetical protein
MAFRSSNSALGCLKALRWSLGCSVYNYNKSQAFFNDIHFPVIGSLCGIPKRRNTTRNYQ